MAHTQHYVHLLTYPFKGENAAGKFALACLVVAAGYLVPVVPWIFFLGYVYQIMGKVVIGDDAHMPIWSDWGRLFRDGVKLFGLSFIYALPINVIFIGGFFLYFVSMFAFALAAEASPNSAAPLLIGFIPFIFIFAMAIGYLLLLVFALVFPAAAGNLVAKDRFLAGFDFATMWRVVRANPGGFLIAFLLALGVLAFLMFAAQLVYMTIILCFLLPFLILILFVYFALVSGALFADAYRAGSENLT
jgi:hypothetical protein